MANIEIYTKDWCGYSARAKSLLESKELAYVEHDVTHNQLLETDMRNRSRRRTVPQIFIDGYHIGGFDDLETEASNGSLDALTGDSRISSVPHQSRESISGSSPV
jgi:glutaredoxin 3